MISSPAHTIQPTEPPQKTVLLAATQVSIAKTPITPVLEEASAMTPIAEVVDSSEVIQEATLAEVLAVEIPEVEETRAVAVAISNVLLA